jgi:hypothetical protein
VDGIDDRFAIPLTLINKPFGDSIHLDQDSQKAILLEISDNHTRTPVVIADLSTISNLGGRMIPSPPQGAFWELSVIPTVLFDLDPIQGGEFLVVSHDNLPRNDCGEQVSFSQQ